MELERELVDTLKERNDETLAGEKKNDFKKPGELGK